MFWWQNIFPIYVCIAISKYKWNQRALLSIVNWMFWHTLSLHGLIFTLPGVCLWWTLLWSCCWPALCWRWRWGWAPPGFLDPGRPDPERGYHCCCWPLGIDPTERMKVVCYGPSWHDCSPAHLMSTQLCLREETERKQDERDGKMDKRVTCSYSTVFWITFFKRWRILELWLYQTHVLSVAHTVQCWLNFSQFPSQS